MIVKMMIKILFLMNKVLIYILFNKFFFIFCLEDDNCFSNDICSLNLNQNYKEMSLNNLDLLNINNILLKEMDSPIIDVSENKMDSPFNFYLILDIFFFSINFSYMFFFIKYLLYLRKEISLFSYIYYLLFIDHSKYKNLSFFILFIIVLILKIIKKIYII